MNSITHGHIWVKDLLSMSWICPRCDFRIPFKSSIDTMDPDETVAVYRKLSLNRYHLTCDEHLARTILES